MRDRGDRTRPAGLRLALGLWLLAAIAVACGGSGAKDTKGGLVGRLSPGCKQALTTIDDATFKVAARADVRPQAAEKAALAVAEATEMRCLERITDWSLAVTRLQKRLALAARTAGKTEPKVACDPPSEWTGEVERVPGFEVEGFVAIATTVIHLSPATCLHLARLVGHPRGLSCIASSQRVLRCRPSLTSEAIAVVILAHEQQHVDGESNEALAQCYAYQRAQAVGRELGVPRRAAARIAAFAKRVFIQPFVYSSTECRRGGSFDLHLPGPWPLSAAQTGG